MKTKLFRALEGMLSALFFVALVAIVVINYVTMYKTIGFVTDLAFFPHWTMLIPLAIGAASIGGWIWLVTGTKPEE